jgi:hypothetical protein
MSSLVHPRGQPFFVVQSGIVTWEDLEPITDWRRKTVSIVSKTLPVAVALLWAVVASRPQQVDRVFRYYLAPISPSITAMQKRRLATGLKTDPPGFAETTLSITDTHACVTSTLRDPSPVDPGFLTAYRRCALVELADSPLPGAELLQEACRTITDLGAAGIGTLLAIIESSALLRILELESYAVVQLIGASEVVDPAIRCLVDRGIRRFQDVRALPHEIAGLRE